MFVDSVECLMRCMFHFKFLHFFHAGPSFVCGLNSSRGSLKECMFIPPPSAPFSLGPLFTSDGDCFGGRREEEEQQEMERNPPTPSEGIQAGDKDHADPDRSSQKDQVSGGFTRL